MSAPDPRLARRFYEEQARKARRANRDAMPSRGDILQGLMIACIGWSILAAIYVVVSLMFGGK